MNNISYSYFDYYQKTNSNPRLLKIIRENTDKKKYYSEIDSIFKKDPSSINKIDKFICFYSDLFWNNSNYSIVICNNGINRKYINIPMKSICENESYFLEMIDLIDKGTFSVLGFQQV
jgi:hypothetical protein